MANVTGPGSSTDTAIARWNGSSGTVIQDSTITVDGGGTMSGVASLAGSVTTTTQSPGDDSINIATTAYANAAVNNLSAKQAVEVASPIDIDLTVAANPNPIDSTYTLLDGQRILLLAEADPTKNGIYIATTAVDPTTWVRSADLNDPTQEIEGVYTFVVNGATYAGCGFVQTTMPATPGTWDFSTDVMTWTQFAGPGTFVGGTDITVTGNTIDFTGNIPVSLNDLNDAYQNNTTFNINIGGKGNTVPTGQANMLAGYGAGAGLTSGQRNAAFGYSALIGISTGSFNTAVGADAIPLVTTGSNNTALGYEAFQHLTTGSSNIGVGYFVGTTLATGSGNILIGNSSVDVPTSSTGNYLNIGNAITGDMTTGPALMNGFTTTTQSAGDNSTKIATTAYVNAAASDSGLSMSNITTNNVSTTQHGFAPKASTNQNLFLGASGAYWNPSDISSGFKNKFRNPTFEVAQRGTSGTVTSGNAVYTLDGWVVGATGATVSWSQNQQSDLSPYALELIGNTSMTDTFVRQRIESTVAGQLFNFNGDPVTVSFWIFQDTGGGSLTPTITVKHAGSADNWSSPVTDVNAVSLSSVPGTTWTNIGYTFAPNIDTYFGLEVTIDFGAALNSSGKAIYILGPDIRTTTGFSIGNIANPIVPELRPIAFENVFCQRYLQSFGSETGPIGKGAATSTTAFGMFVEHAVPMRVPPTGITVKTAADLEIQSYANANVAALTALSFGQASKTASLLTGTVAAGLTAATPYVLIAKTALAGNLLLTGAEL